jgi:DTW domain-containing protein YfiP
MSRYCLKCGKAKKACICSWIKTINTNIELIILQHPTEVNRAKGTAKILSLSLANSHCFVGENFTQHNELNNLLAENQVSTFVLFPSEHSEIVSPKLTENRRLDNKIRIILLDGTWKKAFKIYQLSENLHALPCLRLPQSMNGNYKIRKAPKKNSLSTVEAGYQALKILQPEHDFEPLIGAFNAMVEFYIQQLPEGVYQQNYTCDDSSLS